MEFGPAKGLWTLAKTAHRYMSCPHVILIVLHKGLRIYMFIHVCKCTKIYVYIDIYPYVKCVYAHFKCFGFGYKAFQNFWTDILAIVLERHWNRPTYSGGQWRLPQTQSGAVGSTFTRKISGMSVGCLCFCL